MYQKYCSYRYCFCLSIVFQGFFLVGSQVDDWDYQLYENDPNRTVTLGGFLEIVLKESDFKAPVHSCFKEYVPVYPGMCTNKKNSLPEKRKKPEYFCSDPKLTPEMKKVRINSALEFFKKQQLLKDENSSSELSNCL